LLSDFLSEYLALLIFFLGCFDSSSEDYSDEDDDEELCESSLMLLLSLLVLLLLRVETLALCSFLTFDITS